MISFSFESFTRSQVKPQLQSDMTSYFIFSDEREHTVKSSNKALLRQG